MTRLLEAGAIGKRFGGVQALHEVSFHIAQREIFGLIGPNGAGKTTLFNVLTGIYSPDSGSFSFGGQDITGLTPDRIAAAGIARTFQNIRLFANLSALENVMIGRHVRTRAGVMGAILRNRSTLEEERAIEQRASSSSTMWASGGAPTTPPGACPTATSGGLKLPGRSRPSRSS